MAITVRPFFLKIKEIFVMLSDVLPMHSFSLADIDDLILDMTVNV